MEGLSGSIEVKLVLLLVRTVKPSDFDDIVEVYFSFFPEAAADPSFGLSLYRELPSMEEEKKWFEGALKAVEERNLLMLVAEVDSHVVGWCEVRRKTPGSPTDHRGTVGVCVKKGYRGEGVGTALLKAAIEESRGKFEALELAVLKNNKKAIDLYRRLGFKSYGTLPKAVKRAGKYFQDELMYFEL